MLSPRNGKAQLRGVEQQRVAAEREAGQQIARAGLVVGEAAMRRAAAAEEVLGDRHVFERDRGPDVTRNGRITAELGVAGEHDIQSRSSLVVGVAAEEAEEVLVAAEERARQARDRSSCRCRGARSLGSSRRS